MPYRMRLPGEPESVATAVRPRPEVRPRRGRRRVAGGLVAVIAVLAGIGGFAAIQSGTDATPLAVARSAGVWEETAGIYRFADGQQFTLYGSERSPEYELGGTWVGLVADGEDRFRARDVSDEVVTIRRDPDGRVVGLDLARPGEPDRWAVKEVVYTEEEVRFEGPGAELSGTLILPSGPGPHPAVVIVHGAEYGTREVYRLLATHFARRGVAVLIYDKRGVGQSTGSFSGATFEDLTGDALGGVARIAAHPAIDPNRVGLAGFSQGGWIVAMAADRSEAVGFVIGFSVSGFTPGAQAAWLSGNLLSLRGLDERSTEMARRGWAMMYSSRDLVEAGVMPAIPDVPGFWFHSLDPELEATPLWAMVEQPVLALWGETDCQVPALESATAIAEALRSGGNNDHKIRILPGASHSLALVDPCAHEMGGMSHHGMRFEYAPDYLMLPAEWVLGLGSAGVDVVVPDADATSPLGWHQSPNTGTSWYGSFLPQLSGFVLIVAVSGLVIVNWLWSRTFGRRRRLERGVEAVWSLTGAVAAGVLVATMLAAAAMVELLMLGDVHADFLVGGPAADGSSPLLSAAAMAAWVAATLGVGLLVALLRSRLLPSPVRMGGQSRANTLMVVPVVLFLASAGYWGLFSVRLLG